MFSLSIFKLNTVGFPRKTALSRGSRLCRGSQLPFCFPSRGSACPFFVLLRTNMCCRLLFVNFSVC